MISRITRESRVIVMDLSNNPTKSVFHYGDFLKLAKLVIERDLCVISDEIYEKIVYGGVRHVSVTTLRGKLERPCPFTLSRKCVP